MENKKYQDVMSRLSVTPEMAERVLQGIRDVEDIDNLDDIEVVNEAGTGQIGQDGARNKGQTSQGQSSQVDQNNQVDQNSQIVQDGQDSQNSQVDQNKQVVQDGQDSQVGGQSRKKADESAGAGKNLIRFEDRGSRGPAGSKGKGKRSGRFGRFTHIAAALALFLAGSLLGVSIVSPGNSYESVPAMKSDYSQEGSNYAQEEESYETEDYQAAEPSGQDNSSGYGMTNMETDQVKTGSGQDGSSGQVETGGQGKTGQKDSSADQGDGSQKNQNQTEGQKLIYRATVRIETDHYQDSLKALKAAIGKAGGYIESENENSYGYGTYGYSNHKNLDYEDSDYGDESVATVEGRRMENELVIRVPVGEYQSFMEGMADYGVVISKSQNVDNVTTYYHDTEVQIKALKIQETRLLQMMEKAKTIEEMILVEERLTEVQTELDSYESTLKGLDDQVDYATVSISLDEVREYRESPEAGFGEKAKSRLEEGFENFAEGIVNLILTILYLLPAIIFITVIVILVRFIMKRKGWKMPFRKKKDQDMDPDVFDE